MPRPSITELRGIEFDALEQDRDTLFQGLEDMFDDLNLLGQFDLKKENFKSFMSEAEKLYRNNPYHNFPHAFDVCQFAYHLITSTSIRRFLPPVDILAVLLSAICHDAGHPGTNNAFQVNNNTEFAQKYGAESTLEVMHFDQAHHILARSELLWDLPAETQHSILVRMEQCILATDMAFHGKQLSALSELSLPSTEDDLSPLIEVDKTSVATICGAVIKCSDINNAARPLSISDKWGRAVRTEFWDQGDAEKGLGDGNVSLPMFDRVGAKPHAMQSGFVSFVVVPLFEQLANKVAPEMKEPGGALYQLKENLGVFKERQAKEAAGN